MGQRARLYDCRISRLPRILGLCQDNIPAIAEYVNGAQSRLLHAKEAHNESWYGTWAEIAFTLSRDQPYVTLTREIARLESATVCDAPIPVENQFIEYLQFGNGRLRKNRRCGTTLTMQAVNTNNAVTFVDMTDPPQYLRMYISDARDVGKRVLLQGTDANDNTIYSTDVRIEVTGIFVALDSPFVTSTLTFNTLTGIQKDVTFGKVEFYQVDPDDGTEILLLTMQPGETIASYRRYFFNALPNNCCPNPSSTDTSVQITAIAKLELIPVVVDTDWLLLPNVEALIHECNSMRYDESDSPSAKAMAQNEHLQAIRLLNGQLGHYFGVDQPAVNFQPFGSATLERVSIGMI